LISFSGTLKSNRSKKARYNDTIARQASMENKNVTLNLYLKELIFEKWCEDRFACL
jgi:hypothetical protein